MTTLTIKDLDRSDELDRNALETVCGGSLDNFFSYDQLLSGIKLGDVTSNLGVVSRGNVLSPTIVTDLTLYMPINTVVQLDMDSFVATETIVASSFAGGTETP